MGSITGPLVALIPWDPESPEQRERLYQQRIACGWNQEAIGKWRDAQLKGQMAIHWVVSICVAWLESSCHVTIFVQSSCDVQDAKVNTKILTDINGDKDARLEAHTSRYPAEIVPITDTACHLQGKPRKPTHASFIPVGHISLDSALDWTSDSRLTDVTSGVYHISSFYVSKALQSGGLGRATMDVLEDMASAEPLCAKVLTLRTMSKTFSLNEERIKALGLPPAPKVCCFLFLSASLFCSCAVTGIFTDMIADCKSGLVWETRL